eukprot:s243_g26.t1
MQQRTGSMFRGERSTGTSAGSVDGWGCVSLGPFSLPPSDLRAGLKAGVLHGTTRPVYLVDLGRCILVIPADVGDRNWTTVQHDSVQSCSNYLDLLFDHPVAEVYADEVTGRAFHDRHSLVTFSTVVDWVHYFLLIASRVARSLTATFGRATRATQRSAVVAAVEAYVSEVDCGVLRRAMLERVFVGHTTHPVRV